MLSKQKIFIAAIIGNILEHYDSALYSFLAPLLAPQFFPNYDRITALILTYGLLPLGILSKPIGALVIGRLGDLYGRNVALSFSMIGMALVTGMIGFLPTYIEIGVLAPLLLAVGRTLQSFFLAGESTGAAVYIFENIKTERKNWLSGLYAVSTVLGILLASGMVTILTLPQMPPFAWRFVFWFGFVTGMLGFYIRYYLPESPEFIASQSANLNQQKESIFFLLKKHHRAVLRLLVVSGFSYATYAAAFVFFNSFAPQVTNISLTTIMTLNTGLLLLDMLLLPIFGRIADRYSAAKIMGLSALCLAVTICPLFWLLQNASLFSVVTIRICIIMMGVAFAAPFAAFAQTLFPIQARYRLIGFSYAIGSQLIGATLPAICLWLYKVTKLTIAPGIYLTLLGLVTYQSLRSIRANKA